MARRRHVSAATIRSLAFVAFILPAFPAYGPDHFQQVTRALWTQAQGLPQDAVHAIRQTPDGYLWLAANEGLTRFDGYDFYTFSTENSALPSNTINALETDREGSLWIGTPSGLVRYRDHQFRTYTTRDGLPANNVRSILVGGNDAVWIIAGKYLSCFAEGHFGTIPMSALFPLRAAQVLYEDHHQTLWVGGVDGVLQMRGQRFLTILGPKQMEGNIPHAMIADRGDDLWIAGSHDLVKLRPDGGLEKFPADGRRRNQVRAFLEDAGGNIWAGSEGGLNRLETGTSIDWDLSGIHIEAVRALFEDRESNLWVAMYSGLNRFRDPGFLIYGAPSGLPAVSATTVFRDRDGGVWIGYSGEGVVTFDHGRVRRFSAANGLPSDEVHAISQTRNGDLLISTAEGLSRYHRGHFRNERLTEPLALSVIDSVEDKSGNLWMATRAGLFLQPPNGPARKVISADPVYLDSTSAALAEGLDGTIWFGVADVGLWRLRDGKRTLLTAADGLGSNRIHCLYQDPDGALWIGTLGSGVDELRGQAIYHYRARNGLLADNISRIVDDGLGSLWFQTSKGVSRVRKRDLRAFSAGQQPWFASKNYIMEDRFRSDFHPPDLPGATEPRDRRVWFPTSRGATAIDPASNDERTPRVLPVHILDVTVDNRQFTPDARIRLGAGPRRVQIRYAAVHLSAPEQVRYEYKMDGIDTEWVRAGSRRELNYMNLPHGTYVFHVRASISGGATSVATLEMTIPPHLYQEWYFLSIAGLSGLCALYGLYWRRIRTVQHEFALVLQERIRIAREIHDTLAQGLVGISAELQAAAIETKTEYSPVQRHIRTAQNMCRHSLTEARRAMRELRDLPHRDVLTGVASTVRQWRLASPGPDIELRVEGISFRLAPDVEKNLIRIAQEAIANAVKHSKANRIDVALRFSPKLVYLAVNDDGAGFQISGALSLEDGHFGLVGMRERAEVIGADLGISSALGSGTRIELRFVVSQPHRDTPSAEIPLHRTFEWFFRLISLHLKL